MDYSYERYDIVNILSKILKNNDEETLGSFKNTLNSYINYIQAVVEHVTYEFDFRQYGGGRSSREDMEMYNKSRVQAHNEAIKNTLKFQSEILEKYSYIYYDGAIGKKEVKDFTPEERTELGNYIFRTVATCSTLTKKEKEKIGIEEDIFNDMSRKIDKLERGYKTRITADPSDIYENLK